MFKYYITRLLSVSTKILIIILLSLSIIFIRIKKNRLSSWYVSQKLFRLVMTHFDFQIKCLDEGLSRLSLSRNNCSKVKFVSSCLVS